MPSSPIPKNVVDKDLYKKIKAEIHNDLEAKGVRWGIYASSRLVKLYKKMGGRYSNEIKKTDDGLNRWFKERWINICKSRPPDKLVDCGRSMIKNNDEYPVCRPYYRISPETPTTWGEMDRREIDNICKKKRKNPLKILPSFNNKKK